MKYIQKGKLWLRRILAILLVVIEFAFFVLFILSQNEIYRYARLVYELLSFFVALHIVSKEGTPAYKLLWVLFVLVFPLFGGVFYVLTLLQSKRFSKGFVRVEREGKRLLPADSDSLALLREEHPEAAVLCTYLQDYVGYPVFSDTETEYLPCGEAFLDALLAAIENARSYIFLEYFIIEEGEMWNSILDALTRKAHEGVEIRVLYDEIGSFFLLPTDYPRTLAKRGIKCRKFNPFVPFLTTKQNNRDHRKIAVIDGEVALTGGINLADEYVNKIEKHGHFKDAGILCRGSAAWSFSVMFLTMWAYTCASAEDCSAYLPVRKNDRQQFGFVQPYADSPMDRETVGESIYLSIISRAKKYVYITTPYLIVDDNILSALCHAARCGVDVRIITPHKWDKWFVHMTTRSYYRTLLEAGVKIYEYEKGFIHSKIFLSDDMVATVGTTNLDYRSLYLHFECGTLLVGTESIDQIKNDFLNTLAYSKPMTKDDCRGNFFTRILQNFLRLLAPLM